jgi:hypothetical protein
MNFRIIAIALVSLVILLAAAGCTQPATPVTTPVPTTVEETAVETATPMTTATPTMAASTPEPTQTLQSIWNVDVQVASNGVSINPLVIMTFRGGKGQTVIKTIDLKVTRSDGVVEEGRMIPIAPSNVLAVGQTLELPGTTSNEDRAEVWAWTPQGDRVKIYDAYIPFRSYN